MTKDEFVMTGIRGGFDWEKGGPVHNDWRLCRWTGWKGRQGSDTLVGQWIAVKLDDDGEERRAVSCVPGRVAEYRKWSEFDIAADKPITISDSEPVKELERLLGLERLWDWIEEHG